MLALFDQNRQPYFMVKILVNWVLWLLVCVTLILFNAIDIGEIYSLAAASAAAVNLKNFLDFKLFLSLSCASIFSYILFYVAGKKLNSIDIFWRAKCALHLLLEDWAGVILNIGTLSLVIAGSACDYRYLAFSILCYYSSYWLSLKNIQNKPPC